MKDASHLLMRLLRMLAVLLLVLIGSTALVRFAPGYLSDQREMDARYAGVARAELTTEAARSQSLFHLVSEEIGGLARRDLGISRQYQVPVRELIAPRLAVSGALLLKSIAFAWTVALAAALITSARRSAFLLWQLPAALLLAVPTAAMATISIIAGSGGTILVMTLILAARDFKFLDSLLRKAWRDPHLLQARAQGISTPRLLLAYIFPGISAQLLTLTTLSIVTALSALVPVEVIFNQPGLGQLAWNAAMNRDLPVLLAATLIMAVAVTIAGMVSDRTGQWKTA